MDAVTQVPVPVNEPVLTYPRGSPERADVQQRLTELAAERHELTCTIGGDQKLGGGEEIDVVEPHARSHVLGTMRNATQDDARAAIDAARRPRRDGAPSRTTIARPSSSRPPSCWPVPGGRR